MELLGSHNTSKKLAEQRQKEKKHNHSYWNIKKKKKHINQSAKGFHMCWNEQNGEEQDHPSKSRMNPWLALSYQPKMINLPNVSLPSFFAGLTVSISALTETRLLK